MQLSDLLIRVAAGFAISIVISLVAQRLRALTRSGAIASTIVGTVAISAGWSWAALLFSMFISVALLSEFRAAEKTKRLGGLLEKGAERDAAQVVANGAVFTLAAIGHLISPATGWYALTAGALAFSAADTWATEIGTLARGNPRSITTARRVPTGTSGGVSLIGTLGAVAGSLFIGSEAVFAAWPVPLAAVLLGGVLAALADSFIGATLQARRFCPRCRKPTEAPVHKCGTATTLTGGIAWLDNDVVNALCSAIGALIVLVLQ
ncbi:MAG TPA: DUF92 domain-containing protein [Gemmatimonadaceae bacterium]|nr:DUF92 domain-containing protein [Gemmatimonadaceae bacterium]